MGGIASAVLFFPAGRRDRGAGSDSHYLVQFLAQIVGVIVLRVRRPDLPRPFRMWLYPLPALLASVGFIFVLVSRTNSLRQVRYAVVILMTGIAIYMVRAWRNKRVAVRRPNR